jgi:dTDP-4-amino-4,6-dideoxygalactose transaminase
MEPYVSEPPPGGYHLPATEHLCRRIMVLPAGAAVTPVDVRRMGRVLAAILASGTAIRNTLAGSSARKECKA